MIVARHAKRQTGYVAVKIGPHTDELATVTTVSGSKYLVRTEHIEFTPPSAKSNPMDNLGVLLRALA